MGAGKALAGLLMTAGMATADPRPDILVIVADDLGFSDLGSYGGEIRTPTLDSLAMGGARFTQMHNAARCCPTRASLLTGLYAHQAGLGRNGNPMNRNGATLPEILGSAGYQTCMVGKWHLSDDIERSDQLAWLSHRVQYPTFADTNTYPVKRGFQRHWGTIWGVLDYYDPFSLVEGTKAIPTVPAGYYHTDALNDKAVEYLEEMGRSDQPIFLYLAHNAPHWPLHAPESEVQRYAARYTEGWDSLRVRRYRKQLEMGLISAGQYPLPDFENDNPWTAAADKAWHARNMAVHAAMVDRMDQGLARVIAKLKQLGRFDNTLILFLSDNGASPEVTGGPGYDRPNTTRDGTPITYGGRPQNGGGTVWGGIGPMWANAANTPFRYWKKESYEGGIATPFFVHWPQGLKLPKGSVNSQLGHVIDIAPTLLAAAGVAQPATWNGHVLKPMEGKSLLPVFQGGGALPERELFWEHEGGRASRKGPWKAVSLAGQPWQLFDMTASRTETENLAGTHAAKLAELTSAYDAWLSRVNAATPVTLKLVSPNGGESWAATSVQTVRWATTNAMGIHNVRLEFNAGAGWQTIAASTPHDGEFAWTVPAPAAPRVKVRVRSAESAHVDSSDGTFAITPGSGVAPTLRPSGGFMFDVDGRPLIFPAWRGAAPEGVAIADAAGRLVRSYSLAPGAAPSWDARNEAGHRVSPGVFSVTLIRKGQPSISRKVLIHNPGPARAPSARVSQ